MMFYDPYTNCVIRRIYAPPIIKNDDFQHILPKRKRRPSKKSEDMIGLKVQIENEELGTIISSGHGFYKIELDDGKLFLDAEISL